MEAHPVQIQRRQKLPLHHSMIERKKCSKCRIIKPIQLFYKSNCPTHYDSFYPSCKSCKNETVLQYQEENPEKLKKKYKQDYWDNKEEKLKKTKEWRYGGNRLKALGQAKNRCEKCENEKTLNVHHKDRQGSTLPTAEQNNDLENLEVLCSSCHRLEHSKDTC